MFDPAAETWSVVRNDAADIGVRAPLGLIIDNVFTMIGGRDSTGQSRNCTLK